MKLLVDMNLSPTWIPFLSQNGFEAVHWSQLGAVNTPDSEIMAFAARNGFAIFTQDLDFGMLLAILKSSGPSVIQIRTQDTLPHAFGQAVVLALAAARSDVEKGSLVTIDAVQHRIRLLPI